MLNPNSAPSVLCKAPLGNWLRKGSDNGKLYFFNDKQTAHGGNLLLLAAPPRSKWAGGEAKKGILEVQVQYRKSENKWAMC